MTESSIQKRVRLALCAIPGCIMFRNNVGMAKYHDGTALRTVAYGLCKGSSDLIGWTIVGDYAVFTAVEVKRPGKKPTEEQANFINRVIAAGGIAGAARNEREAQAVIVEGIRRLNRGKADVDANNPRS